MTTTDTADIGVGVMGATSMVYTAVVADALAAVDGIRLVHEGSRTGSPKAGIRYSADYSSVLADPAVDMVYIPLPNHLHEEWVLACATAGKHVLCEKPLGIDTDSAARMVNACEAAGVQLLEAYMSPFHPRSAAIQQAVESGQIGRPLHGQARMSGVLPTDNHRWKVDNGGGALLDVGIYCLEPVLSAFGWDGAPPVDVAAASIFAGDGVDETTSAWLAFADGWTVDLWVSFAAPDQQRLQLTGSHGAIEVDVRHATPDRRDSGYALRDLGGSLSEVPTNTGDCYEGMIAHVRDVLRGETEPLRDGARSVAVAAIIDMIADVAGHQR